MTTSPADKATDDVRGLVGRLRTIAAPSVVDPLRWYGQADVRDAIRLAAATLTSLLERAERAERERDEAIVRAANQEDRAERAEARIKELEQALEPFAQALKGNYSHQSDSLLIVAGFNAHDLRFSFQLADFRRARAVKGE